MLIYYVKNARLLPKHPLKIRKGMPERMPIIMSEAKNLSDERVYLTKRREPLVETPFSFIKTGGYYLCLPWFLYSFLAE